MEEATIKEILSKKREYEAKCEFLSCFMDDDENQDDKDRQDELKRLKMKIMRINLWLALLSEDEAYVVTRHLIDGIDVPRIAVEYERKWGSEFAKTERTIKMYQRRALKKIEAFERKPS